MNAHESFAITLYVPDATARALNEGGSLRRVILDGVPELDFLPPPWWEGSHTVRLGLMQVDGGVAQESNTCGEAWGEGPEPKRSAAFRAAATVAGLSALES